MINFNEILYNVLLFNILPVVCHLFRDGFSKRRYNTVVRRLSAEVSSNIYHEWHSDIIAEVEFRLSYSISLFDYR